MDQSTGEHKQLISQFVNNRSCMLSVENLFHTSLAIMDKPPCSFLFRGFYIFNIHTRLHSLVHCCDHISLSLGSMPTSIHHYYISDLTKHLSLLKQQSRPHTDVSSCCHCCRVCSYNKQPLNRVVGTTKCLLFCLC